MQSKINDMGKGRNACNIYNARVTIGIFLLLEPEKKQEGSAEKVKRGESLVIALFYWTYRTTEVLNLGRNMIRLLCLY